LPSFIVTCITRKGEVQEEEGEEEEYRLCFGSG